MQSFAKVAGKESFTKSGHTKKNRDGLSLEMTFRRGDQKLQPLLCAVR